MSVIQKRISDCDVTESPPTSQVGLTGEKLKVYTQAGSHRVEWKQVNGQGPALTWYKVRSDKHVTHLHVQSCTSYKETSSGNSKLTVE